METYLKRRIWSFSVGGVLAALFIICGIINSNMLVGFIVLAVMSFTFSSCLILNNNFILDLVINVASWGFVKMPGLIFTLDLDGIIWLLTVKLLFWILGMILAVLTFILAIVLGCVFSLFVYPYAIIRNIVKKEDDEI